MGTGYLVASGSDYVFDTEALVRAMELQFPEAEVHRPTTDLADNVAAVVYLPAPPGVVRNMEIDVLRSGGGLGIEGASSAEEVARFVAWLARTAPVPEDGSVVLIEWADDLVPLTPHMTAEELLAARS